MRYKELDGIRGLAALSVVLFHLTTPKINNFIETENVIPEYLHFSYGNYGVEIFFILSGFVILFSLERKKSYQDFLWARFLRLYPTFWICLLLSTIVLTTIYPGDEELNPIKVLANITMIPKQLLDNNVFIEGSYWTLEYELYFYVGIGLLFYYINRNIIIPVFLGLSLVSLVIQAGSLLSKIQNLPSIIPSVIMRLYGILLIEYAHLFLIGILFYFFTKTRYKSYAMLIIFPIIVAFSYSQEDGIFTSLLSLIFLLALETRLKAFFSLRPLVLLGEISYVLYLIHMNFGRSIISLVANLSRSAILGLACGIISTIILSIIITYTLDIPIRERLKNRLKTL